MRPLFHLVGAVADISRRVIGPLVIAFHDILADRESSRECRDLLEIRTVVSQHNLKSLVIHSPDSQSIRCGASVCHCGISLDHIDHVAVVCSSLRVGQTLPAVLEITGRHFLAVGPLDSVSHLKGISYGAVVVDHLVPGLCLAGSQLCIALSVVHPLDQTLKNMVDGDGAVYRTV